MAATKPTIPASPSPCTKLTILSATPPTNGTFPPKRETTIPSPSKAITTLVKLFIVPVRPDNIFMFSSLFLLTFSYRIKQQLYEYANIIYSD